MAQLPVQVLPSQDHRVETGPLQFGDDWPGVFIRGDNAFGYRMALQAVLSGRADPITRRMASGLLAVLESCDARDRDAGLAGDPQGLHSEGAAARPEGVAQPLSSEHSS